MRGWDRLLLALSSLIVGVVSVVLFLFGIEWLNWTYLKQFIDESLQVDWVYQVYLAITVFLFLASVRLYFVSWPPRNFEAKSVAKITINGEITISTLTLEHLALRSAQQVPGIFDVKTKVRIKTDGISIELRGFVDGEHHIPIMTEEMQKKVKQDVESVSGVSITAIDVRIDDLIAVERLKKTQDKR